MRWLKHKGQFLLHASSQCLELARPENRVISSNCKFTLAAISGGAITLLLTSAETGPFTEGEDIAITATLTNNTGETVTTLAEIAGEVTVVGIMPPSIADGASVDIDCEYTIQAGDVGNAFDVMAQFTADGAAETYTSNEALIRWDATGAQY